MENNIQNLNEQYKYSQSDANQQQPDNIQQNNLSVEAKIALENMKYMKKILNEINKIKRFYWIEFILKHLVSFVWIALAIWGSFQTYNFVNNFLKSDIAEKITNISTELGEVTNSLSELGDMKSIIPNFSLSSKEESSSSMVDSNLLNELSDDQKEQLKEGLEKSSDSSGILDILKNGLDELSGEKYNDDK